MPRRQRDSVERLRSVPGLLTLLGLLALYGIIFGHHGLGRYMALREDLDRRSSEAYVRMTRNRTMQDRLRGLRTDQRALEEAARSTLGVVDDDEIVLVFDTPRGRQRP